MNNCGVAFGDIFKSGRFAATLVLHLSLITPHSHGSPLGGAVERSETEGGPHRSFDFRQCPTLSRIFGIAYGPLSPRFARHLPLRGRLCRFHTPGKFPPASARFFRLLPMPNRKAEPEPHQRLPCKGSWRRSRLRGPRRTRCFRPCPTHGPSGTPAPMDAARNIAARWKIRSFTCRRHISHAKRISHDEGIFHPPAGRISLCSENSPAVFATPYTLP